MHPLLRIIFRFGLLFLVIFVAVQPFNWFCKITNNCQPFYFSYYIPKSEGTKPINISFEITNYQKNLDFSVAESAITTVSGRKNIINYHAKNLSNRVIVFRPSLQVDPQEFDDYLIRYECLCSREFKLKKGEEIDLQMRFEIDKKIDAEVSENEDEAAYGKNFKIIYKIR